MELVMQTHSVEGKLAQPREAMLIQLSIECGLAQAPLDKILRAFLSSPTADPLGTNDGGVVVVSRHPALFIPDGSGPRSLLHLLRATDTHLLLATDTHLLLATDTRLLLATDTILAECSAETAGGARIP